MLLSENRSFHDSSMSVTMPFLVEVSEDLKVSGVTFPMALLTPFSVNHGAPDSLACCPLLAVYLAPWII